MKNLFCILIYKLANAIEVGESSGFVFYLVTFSKLSTGVYLNVGNFLLY